MAVPLKALHLLHAQILKFSLFLPSEHSYMPTAIPIKLKLLGKCILSSVHTFTRDACTVIHETYLFGRVPSRAIKCPPYSLHHARHTIIQTYSGTKLNMTQSNALVKLSEESLTREPEEVFDLLKKIGEG